MDGITGTVTEHPLEHWDSFAQYQAPDPVVCMGIGPINWQAVETQYKVAKDKGSLSAQGFVMDIDRQSITPYGTPKEIDELIREEVEKISCHQGGLTMIYGLYPGVPLENVEALMGAMEKYMFYYN